MKRPLLIIFGISIIALLLAVWVYILFFSAGPQNDPDRFADLNIGDDSIQTPPPPAPTDPVVNVTEKKPLRQLTTKPTAGYQEILSSTSSDPTVWYVESGTGHVFSINLTSGEEKRISGTTIPMTQVAVITPNGRHGMFQSGAGVGREFVVGTFNATSGTMTTGNLSESIIDFTATKDSTFLYAVQTNNSVVAKEYNPASDTATTLFTIPFREAKIVWGKFAGDTHYAHPKASSKLEGFLYLIKDGQLTRLPVDGYGLTAIGTASSILYSKQEEGTYTTYTHIRGATENHLFSLTILPEKCTTLNLEEAYICGTEFLGDYNQHTPDSWYQGVATYADDIWEFYPGPESVVGTYALGIQVESGRTIDTTKLLVNETDERLYFTNKTNQTLWLFDRTVTGSTN